MAFSGLVVGAGWVGNQEWLHPAIFRVYRTVRRHVPGATNRRLLEQVVKELHPNGGSSLRDSLDRLEHKVSHTHQLTKLVLRMQRITDEHAGIATFLTDEHGQCIYANSHYLGMVGLSESEVLRDGWKNVMADKERERVGPRWQEAIRERRDFHSQITYTNYRTGETKTVNVDAFVVMDDGDLIGWAGYVHPAHHRRSPDSCY